ncbi:MAG: class I SAM-dependent methyltransferase [Methanomicrobiales archaeon]|nr:class I SAM-dependent methyltransferase [Methanomicrobiales archaeon]
MLLPTVTIDPKWHTRTTRQYMQPGEIEILLTLIDSVDPCYNMIEFGVNEGITALSVLQNIPSIKHYVGIDVPPDYKFEIPAQQSERPEEPGKLVKSDPRFELVIRPAGIRGLFDVAFIDADHGYSAVRKDYEIAKRLVRTGGMIIFHDYNNPTVEVTQALDDLFRSGSDINSVAGTWLAFERIQ